MTRAQKVRAPAALQKAPTGIPGFDEITAGGLPKGRPSLICGGAGCGKSLFAVEFLVRGALQYGEPGVLMTFEESYHDIEKNVASLGFNIPQLVAQKKMFVDYVHLDRSQIEENGEYDLEGLFLRLHHAITTVGAKRVVLDTIEALFSGLQNQAILRAEVRRLFKWLKDRGMTTVITAERGEGSLTRQGLEEYVSDCVILLDHRVDGQVSTRRLRVVKYRGSTHGTNEYPFLIDRAGFAVMPVTAASMEYTVSSKRISSGIPQLDQMLGGKGYFRGSVALLSGSSGTGKSSVSAHLAHATCQRGERCLFFSFEEAEAQIMRNMKSISIDLEPHVRKGLLQFHTTRPTVHGVEMHLVLMHRLIEEFKPSVVIVDPVSNIHSAGTLDDSTNLLIRLVDFLRKQGITGFLCTLTNGQSNTEYTDEGLSSMVDTWLLLRDIEISGERNRLLYVLKSRGMHHSNQVREFLITSKGIQLIDAYLGPEGVLTGSARLSQKAREEAQEQSAENELQRKKLVLEHRRKTIQAQIEALQLQYRMEQEEFERQVIDKQRRVKQLAVNRQAMSLSRRINH
jgi:circadian clock protein KaiC